MHIYIEKKYFIIILIVYIFVLSLYDVLFFNVFVVFIEINIYSHLINSSNLFYNAF